MVTHFSYTARERTGTRVAGEIVALNAEEAVAALQDAGIWVTRMEPVPLGREKSVAGRVSLSVQERSVLIGSWACLLDSGLSMDAALIALQKSAPHPSVRRALQEIQRLIRDGMTLSEAVDASGLFPPSWASLLESGERRGGFIEPLLALQRHGEQIQKVFQEVLSSLIMPAVLVGLVFLWIWVFATWLLPVMAQTIVDLTGTSNLLFMHLKGLTVITFPALVCATLLLCLLVLAVARGNRSNGLMGTLPARMPTGFPLIGPLISKMHLIIISSELKLQMEAGTPILTALVALCRSMPHRALCADLKDAYLQIRAGTPVWQALGGLRVMPPGALVLLAAGDASGKLPELLGVLVREATLDLEAEAHHLAIGVRSCTVMLSGLIVGLLAVSMMIVLSSAFNSVSQLLAANAVQPLL